MSGRHATGREAPGYKHGMFLERTYQCPCGKLFMSRKLSAKYCSNEHRVLYGRYGRTYGQTSERVYGWTRS